MDRGSSEFITDIVALFYFKFYFSLFQTHYCIIHHWQNSPIIFKPRIERFLYDLEMKTRQQNWNNKGMEIEIFDWFIERIQTRVAFGWLSERSGEKTSCPISIDWFLESSIELSRNQSILIGHEVFSPERSLNQPKATRVCILSINQSNISISIPLLFQFCWRVFISRSYKNRSILGLNIIGEFCQWCMIQ